MIKFSATSGDGGKLLGIGLSEGNVRRLKEGMPILIRTHDVKKLLGIDASITVFYGKTEEEMKQTVSDFIGPNTKVIEI